MKNLILLALFCVMISGCATSNNSLMSTTVPAGGEGALCINCNKPFAYYPPNTMGMCPFCYTDQDLIQAHNRYLSAMQQQMQQQQVQQQQAGFARAVAGAVGAFGQGYSNAIQAQQSRPRPTATTGTITPQAGGGYSYEEKTQEQYH